jgi:phytoene synthase
MALTDSSDPQVAAGNAQAASGSSFYAGMKVLPKPEREAMYAVYGFCRIVDDIADDQTLPVAQQRVELDAWRQDIEALYAGGKAGRAAMLAEAVRGYGLDKADFLAVVDGMQMDLEGIVRPDLATLYLYCDRVAVAVGRLSVKIFGMPDGPGETLAFHLGRALQLTNILRDLDEDAEMGRLYLPAEALEAAGIETRDPRSVIDDPRIDAACRWVAAKAHEQYQLADAVLKARPAGRIRSPRLMREVYQQILRETEAVGWAPPRRRVSLGKARLLWIVLRHGLVD